MAVPVVSFQADGLFTNASVYQRVESFSEPLDDLSLCFWANLNYLRGAANYLISYAVDGIDNAMTACE